MEKKLRKLTKLSEKFLSGVVKANAASVRFVDLLLGGQVLVIIYLYSEFAVSREVGSSFFRSVAFFVSGEEFQIADVLLLGFSCGVIDEALELL